MGEEERGRRLIATFLLGALLLNFPLLAVVERGTLLGLPALTPFLFGAWAVVIGLLALIVERRR